MIRVKALKNFRLNGEHVEAYSVFELIDDVASDLIKKRCVVRHSLPVLLKEYEVEKVEVEEVKEVKSKKKR